MDDTLVDRLETLGENVGHVTLQVDYQIIEHFSENLYDSPNKAVEELVANGFDAFASQVHVFTPGPLVHGRVLVWDDGLSMDVEGLKKLWWIAKSPKSHGTRTIERAGTTRKMIGKFGIGKLASYSVGETISHLCRHNDDFYLVGVDYAEVHGVDGKPPVSYDTPIKAPIVGLHEEPARELVEDLFDTVPTCLPEMFDRETWTLAIIERLKVPDLPPGRLTWVLGNGMPLRPDFAISVNETPVQSKLAKSAAVNWNLGTPEVLKAIQSHWKDGVQDGAIDPLVQWGRDAGLDPASPAEEIPFVSFAELGRVWGTVRLFDKSLLSYRAADQGRSHGFFLLIRGRLLNPDDDKLYLPDPSFQTFYKSQFILHADGLDDELLADRNHLRQDASIRELTLLQKALASIARTTVEARESQAAEEASARSLLPLQSRTYYRAPLNALLFKLPVEDTTEFDPASAPVERTALGAKQPLSIVDSAFRVNTSHPYYDAIASRAGASRAAREFLRTLDLFAVSERLLEGHLYDRGLDDETVQDVIAWRDGLFRKLARAYDTAAPEMIQEMYRTSYIGGRAFETALHRVFDDMGFRCSLDGRSGRKDILAVATVGPESFGFTIEAKGSKGDIRNDDAEVATAASHRDEAGVEHAVIIARRFAGFGDERDRSTAAVLKECRSTGRVSIMELDAVEAVHSAIQRFSYPLPLLTEIFSELQTPSTKLQQVDNLVRPTEGFDYQRLLEEIWRRQGDEAQEDFVPYRAVFQQCGWKQRTNFGDFQRRIVALETLAAGRVSVSSTRESVYLRQSPDLVLDQIENSLRGSGHDISEELPEKS